MLKQGKLKSRESWKEWKKDGEMEREGERGQRVLFITANPDTVAFSAHMDWIIGYVVCSNSV